MAHIEVSAEDLDTLVYMAWQFVRRSRQWMKGRPVGWRSDWAKNVLLYVVGQRKVQASRPGSGAPMHLMLFWGFLALFVATTLLAVATYAPLIGVANFHKGAYYLVYETTFDVFGLFFLAGVVWAIGLSNAGIRVPSSASTTTVKAVPGCVTGHWKLMRVSEVYRSAAGESLTRTRTPAS